MGQPALPNLTTRDQTAVATTSVSSSVNNEANSSGVSWAAVIGGGFVTAALSLILLALGAGLGFSSVSPWSNVAASASTVGKAAFIWLILMQIISSSMGGYLAGRLRNEMDQYSHGRSLFPRYGARISSVGGSVSNHRRILGFRSCLHGWCAVNTFPRRDGWDNGC